MSKKPPAFRHLSACLALLVSCLGLVLVRPAAGRGGAACIDGSAAGFACSGVDLVSQLDLEELGAGEDSRMRDVWGWRHPGTGREFALIAFSDGTAFVEVTSPENPVYLGRLPETGANGNDLAIRDVKTYENFAFIVAEFWSPAEDLQIFDLNQLLAVPSPPVTFFATATFRGGGYTYSENLTIIEETGLAMTVADNCSDLRILDLSDPTMPTSESCVSGDLPNDAQCVLYSGPDADYLGREICFVANRDELLIVDVTNRSNPDSVSTAMYQGAGYAGQVWLTEDHAQLLLSDIGDELFFVHDTKTYVWDLLDLDAPEVIGVYNGATAATDRSILIDGDAAFQAASHAGLRILDLGEVATGQLEEIAFFDSYPANDIAGFGGVAGVFPFLESGTILVSDDQNGLLLLRATALCEEFAGADDLVATPAGDQQIDLAWSGSLGPGETFSVYRSVGSCPGGSFERVAEGLTSPGFSDTQVSGGLIYSYDVRRVAENACLSLPSGCDDASTTGACVEPALFGGLVTVESQSTSICGLELSWEPGQTLCGEGLTYSVYRSTSSDFLPAPGNRIAQGLTGTTWTDHEVEAGVAYYYVVRSVDAGNLVEDANLVRRIGRPGGSDVDGVWFSGAEIGGLSLDVEPAGWEPSEVRARTGQRSFFSGARDGLCVDAATESLSLTPGESPELTFWTVYDIEDDGGLGAWDGGVVEISVDGSSWQRLEVSPGYPATWRDSRDACGEVEGDPVFSGTQLTWTQYTADLSSWAGQSVKIRWRYSSDAYQTGEGWYLDDLSISHAQVPDICSSAEVFSDGFESGDVSAWSTSVP